MKLIRCIDNECYEEELTKDKVYSVYDDDGELYFITCDLGCGYWFSHDRFEEIQTEEQTEELIKPTYYNKENGISPFDYIKANNLNYFEGNIIKYITRYKEKNGLEDLLKAKTYLDELIKQNK